jgi:protease-4
VLRIDSPGGSAVASDAIRRAVLEVRSGGTPVVASMASLAASGGYFIAMPCDRVLASPGTLTGSIGVLGGKQVLSDALARIGITRGTVSAGRYADMFSTDRPFDEEEWARVESWLDRIYDDFTGKVAHDRGLPLERVREFARGRVWTGSQAAANGLIDGLGGLSAAGGGAGAARRGRRPRRARRRPPPQRRHPTLAAARPGGDAAPAGEQRGASGRRGGHQGRAARRGLRAGGPRAPAARRGGRASDVRRAHHALADHAPLMRSDAHQALARADPRLRADHRPGRC